MSYSKNQSLVISQILAIKAINTCSQKKLGIDTEFSSFDYLNSHLLVVQLGDEETQLVFLWHDLTNEEQKFILDLIEDETILKIGHNIKSDLTQFMAKYDMIPRNIHDTMVNHQTLFKGMDMPAGYGAVVEQYFGVKLEKETQKVFIDKTPDLVLTDKEIEYCKNDVKYLIPLYEKQCKGAINYNLEEDFQLSNELTLVLSEMEVRGIKFDSSLWLKNTVIRENKLKVITNELQNLFAEIYKEFPKIDQIEYLKRGIFKDFLKEFSITSPTQVTKMLNKLISLPDTNEATLTTWIKNHTESYKDAKKEQQRLLIVAFIQKLLELRTINKSITTYGRKFLSYVRNGRIRTSYKQNFTSTGRLASGDTTFLSLNSKTGKETRKKANLFVNLLNIPRDNDYRHCFIADDGWKIGNADLSSCELRIIAGLSQDKFLINAILNDLDLHSILATESFKIIKNDPLFEISETQNKELRTLHKPVLFGLLYGGQAKRVSEILNIPVPIAAKVVTKIKQLLPDCFKWLEKYIKKSMKNGYAIVNTVLNRRLWLGDYLNSVNNGLQYKKLAGLERELSNLPMQGTNADIMREILVRAYKMPNIQVLGTVYDELIFQFKDDSDAYAVKDMMEDVGNKYLVHPIIMKAVLSIGPCWSK